MPAYELVSESVFYQRIVGPCTLRPGSYWKIEAKPSWTGGWCPEYLEREGIFVRDEKIDNRSWHVFASLDVCGAPDRVRISTGDVSIREEVIRYEGPLVVKGILSDRGDRYRYKGLDRFIDTANALMKDMDDERIEKLRKGFLPL